MRYNIFPPEICNFTSRYLHKNKKMKYIHDTHNNMHESQNLLHWPKKPDRKRVDIVWFHLYDVLEQTKLIYAKKREQHLEVKGRS